MGLKLPKQEALVLAKPKGNERERIIRMRMALVMGSPFYGLLALRMKLVERAEVMTASTDGKHMHYNPAYVAGLTDAQLRGLVAHETLHNANGHVWRRGTRQHRLWNVACDYAIDSVLTSGGFDVPNALVNPEWVGKSAEEIYALLFEEIEQERRDRQKEDQSNQQGEGSEDSEGAGASESKGEPKGKSKAGAGKPGDKEGGGGPSFSDILGEKYGNGPTKGEVMDAPTETAIHDQAEWKQAVAAAAEVARGHGQLPSNLEQMIQQAVAPRIDWKAVLRRFVQTCAKLDYSWRQPSPRYAASGVYLPRLRSEQMPPMVVVADTSGSTWAQQATFYSELASIIEEAAPEVVHFVQCDAKVQKTEELMPGDPIMQDVKGGGGTDFRPAFAWVEERGIEPACLVYLTDCYGTFPDEEPPYPVIWVSTSNPEHLAEHYTPKFGDVLYLDIE